MPQTSFTVNRCGLSGGVTAVNGWVRDASSNGIVLAGTARSSTAKIGRPVSPLSTKSMPSLFACSTAGTRLPSLESVTNAGGDALS
jgi:hypothetical protein